LFRAALIQGKERVINAQSETVEEFGNLAASARRPKSGPGKGKCARMAQERRRSSGIAGGTGWHAEAPGFIGNSRASQNRKVRSGSLRQELASRDYVSQLQKIAERLAPDTKDAYQREDVPMVKERVGVLFRILDKTLPT
jgi:hypothetical protein